LPRIKRLTQFATNFTVAVFLCPVTTKTKPFLHSPNADSRSISASAVIVDCATIKSRCNSVRELRPNNQFVLPFDRRYSVSTPNSKRILADASELFNSFS
jgi:hypothetical protein